MTVHWERLSQIPTTQLRILVSIALAVVYVLGCIVGILAQWITTDGPMWALGLFILSMMAADIVQFAVKRKSYVPDAPPQINLHVDNPSSKSVPDADGGM